MISKKRRFGHKKSGRGRKSLITVKKNALKWFKREMGHRKSVSDKRRRGATKVAFSEANDQRERQFGSPLPGNWEDLSELDR